MKQKLKRILACVLVLCMGFGVQSNLAFAQENVAYNTEDISDEADTMTDGTKDTDTTSKDDLNTKTEENVGDSQHSKYGLTDREVWEECNQCSKDNPHLISTTAELDKVRTHTHTEGNVTTITGYFKLVNDIVFTDEDYQENGAFYNNGWGWTPIGHNNKTSYFSGDQFQGDFNGDDYAVKNIKIERPAGYWYNGLFAAPGDNAHIYNLKLEGFTIHADGAGALYGQSYATKKDSMLVENITVDNSCITGISSAAKYSGIFAACIKGMHRNITISNSTYKSERGAWKGGFIASEILTGMLENVTVTDCEMTPFAYTGMLMPGIGMDTVIKDVVIKDSTVNITHHAWSYLIFEDYRSNSIGLTPVISDVKIDVNIQGTTANLKGAKTTIPKLKNTDVSPIQMDNIDVHDVLTDKTTNSQSKVDFSVDTNVISIPSDAEKNIKAEERYIVSLNGGHIRPETVNEEGKLIADRSGYAFDGWYENKELNGDSIEKLNYNTYYYAKWIELKDQSISMEYGSTKELPTVSGVTLSEWTSADESVAKVKNGEIKTVNAGKTTLTAKASTASGGTATFTVNVEVTPMRIIYGSPDETEDGRPYIVYSLNEDGTAPKISDILGFYPVKEKQGESGYEADTSKPKITLNPGMGADGDVEYTYVNDVSNNKITTDTLPIHPTVDENGNPHSIRVEMKLKNPNYRFTTIGTNWQQGDTITLFVACYEEGMNEVDMYLEGESEPLKIFEEQVYEYTGQGVVPTTKDLTTLYTKGKNTSNTITKFTVHFHAVAEDTKFAGSYIEQVTNDQLTKEALEKIAPRELGVYSFVINGYNKDTKTYSYVSRRYSIVKGKPTGNPVFDVIESGKSLLEVQLSGTMKNKIGETVAGTFTWEDGNQTVESGKAYKWTFTPDDTNHYEVVNGESIVCPIPMEELNAIPTINASDKTLTVGDTFNPLDGVTASDKEDGDITEKVEVLSNDVDTSKAGTYTVIYKVTDSKGASSTKTITVTVKGKDTQKPTIDDNKKPSATDTDKKPASTDKQTTSNSPKTGDSTNMTTWLALMFVSLGLLAGVFTVRKSRKSR